MKYTTSILALGVILAPQAQAAWGDIRHLFTFGDSYSATGFDPKGVQPNPENPLGNPKFPGRTSSNGPNWIDFLTRTYNESYIKTYNLAYGGATVDSELISPSKKKIPSVKQQVKDRFLPNYSSKPDSARWSEADSLFAFFIGINDVNKSYKKASEELFDKVFDVYSDMVGELYKVGARNFLFLNIPPIDRSPLTIKKGKEAQETQRKWIKEWNDRVDKLAKKTRERENVNVFQFSTHKLFTKVLDNPRSCKLTAGYKSTKKYCKEYAKKTPEWDTFIESCKIPVNQYFWLDSLHPTYPIHNATASGVARMLKKDMD
ncbi:hypothetical protein AJ79_03347 [Helicocarpus griseus UAMH5409]|uniref:SGNH hydrolase-type esterase domain-containing protein n=1 Tax=Helicocarpus griseus UAMH5409 TaxID=1447875 RepID=A0A2B7XZ77_9EURO|nr:hypothetical protein AJ79_03347 [Helicocarpus griseus UAMH5409]